MRYVNDETWIQRVAYLFVIFDHLNKLNLKLQDKETQIVYFLINIQAFILELQNRPCEFWKICYVWISFHKNWRIDTRCGW